MNATQIIKMVRAAHTILELVEPENPDLASALDIFTGPQFMETYIMAILGGQPMKSSIDHVDCIYQETPVEIKHSNLMFRMHSGYPTAYFKWVRLRGRGRTKDGLIEYVILSGYVPPVLRASYPALDIPPDDCLLFWGIPYAAVLANPRSTDAAEYQVSTHRTAGGRQHWIHDYFIGYGETKLHEHFSSGEYKKRIAAARLEGSAA